MSTNVYMDIDDNHTEQDINKYQKNTYLFI